ncbi:Laccase-3 [Platanthera guangdongensis]|uniref:laccase n=1 Tax=Platanthera guangdongensis TaxID=2320717 RepID=A0ABR2LUX8_9ASPA
MTHSRPFAGASPAFLQIRYCDAFRRTTNKVSIPTDQNPIDVINYAIHSGAAPKISDAFTINGQPGDLFSCSTKASRTEIFPVKPGESNLLRFINAALNTEHFVSIAGHIMIVVAAHTSYTKPFSTSLLILAPGQTTDIILIANQPISSYHIAARAYASAESVAFDDTTATAILDYDCGCLPDPSRRTLPSILPAFNDTAATVIFSAALKSLAPVKLPGPNCGGPNDTTRFGASINNFSFPSTYSILQAHQFTVPGVFADDFPARPPVEFDYTGGNIGRELWQLEPATKVYKLKYGSVVELVLQGTAIYAAENHPIHLHGHNFYVLGKGFGNFDPVRDPAKFNLVDPTVRNTVGVPVKGWSAIRFVANNPKVWLLHCNLDVHIT